MKVVVLGGSGQIGRLLTEALRESGAQVLAAQRSAGVDAATGAGLASAFGGADVVVDCTNITTTRAKVALDFFGTVAGNVARAADEAGVGRVVCLSIINAARPSVNKKNGYYQGKGLQEKVYRDALGDRVTIVRSAQWYELAAQIADMARLGPISLVPHMLSRPLSAQDAARLLADVVLQPPGRDIEIAGPTDLDLLDVAKAIAGRTGSPRWTIGINFGGKAFRDGGLLPDHPDIVAPTTLSQWLDKEYPA